MACPFSSLPLQSHVICTPAAAAVIKTYSPNLMVHPLMRQTPSSDESDRPDPSQVASGIIAMLPRLHVLVVGPGLGRDPLMLDTVSAVLSAARARDLPVVLDADALQVVQRAPDLVRGWRTAVLTPNVVEFGRLCGALGVSADEAGGVEALARALGGVTIIQKGKVDVVSDGSVTRVVDLRGGRKRSGGQGDTLTGAIGTFLAWRKAYLDGIWDVDGGLSGDEMVGLAAFGGSAVTRVRFFFPPLLSLHPPLLLFHRSGLSGWG